MRRILLTVLLLVFCVAKAMAGGVVITAAATINSVMFKGYIIDNLSASMRDSAESEKLVKDYTKEKALLYESIKSGYSLLSNGKLYKFDEISNIRIMEFLQKANSGLRVAVMAKKTEGELSLVSIENQR